MNRYPWDMVEDKIYSSTDRDFKAVLYSDFKSPEDFFPMFSPAADRYLEEMAILSNRNTIMRFGKTIQLYAPLYISNECVNSCVYCGFNIKNKIKRLTLSPDLVVKESEILYQKGFRHILLVTGEHRGAVPVSMLCEIAKRLHNKFSSISIEVYPMDEEEYSSMVRSGIDGLALYQETYNRKRYSDIHPAGKKRDFSWRLAAVERGGAAGFRKIGIGALLGISDWRVDGFFLALHASYLMKRYWKSHIQISFPRLRGSEAGYVPPIPVSDKDLTHLICAMRIIHHDLGLVMSTRESASYRNNIMPLGITMMSAGSKTEPGGYSKINNADGQFRIEDTRPPDRVVDMIRQKGFDPVWKDWDRDFLA